MLLAALAVMAADGGLGAASAAVTAAWIVALSPLLSGAVVRTHFDLVPGRADARRRCSR